MYNAGSMKNTKISIQPLGDRIVVKELIVEGKAKKTLSGIIIPESVGKDKGTYRGTVVAVGKGKYIDGKLIPLEVKVGDTVLFQWGEKIQFDGEEYQVVSDSSIMAII